jgi:hypothetical protein
MPELNDAQKVTSAAAM